MTQRICLSICFSPTVCLWHQFNKKAPAINQVLPQPCHPVFISIKWPFISFEYCNSLPQPWNVQSSLDNVINSNSNEIIHKQVKHDTKDSFINPFQFDRLSVTSVQQESASHQSSSAPTISSREQLDSMAPNALPSPWNPASYYSHCKPKTPLHFPYTREQTERKLGIQEIWRV